jgi:uncharacterized membrane protein
MDYLKEVLRLIHILGGMYWFGAVLAMYYFITPTVAATGDAGQQFMRQLGGKSGFSTSILIAAVSAAVAGAWLYWADSNGFQSDWMRSSSGFMFGLGGFFGAIALVLGIIVNRTLTALGKLGAQVQGKPTPKQMGQIQALQKRAGVATQYTCYTLIVAAICMSLARYFVI